MLLLMLLYLYLGTLPSRGQRSTLNACHRGFLTCCENNFTVQVQNCIDYNVFYLTTIPACPGRYCTGNIFHRFKPYMNA